VGCIRAPVDVLFNSDPRILRGTWQGNYEKGCDATVLKTAINPDATAMFIVSSKGDFLINPSTGTINKTLEPPQIISDAVWEADKLRFVFEDSSRKMFVTSYNPQNNALESSQPIGTRPANLVPQFSSGFERFAYFEGQTITLKTVQTNTTQTINAPESIRFLKLSSNALVFETFSGQVWHVNLATLQQTRLVGLTNLTLSYLTQTALLVATSNQTTKIIQKIQLSDLSQSQISLDHNQTIRFSSDGSRAAQFANGNFVVYNLETGAVIAQTTGAVIAQTAATGFIYSSNTSGSHWVVSGEQVDCATRVFDVSQGTFLPQTVLDTPTTLPVVFQFTPTYINEYRYAVQGTVQVGTEAVRNVQGEVFMPRACSVFFESNPGGGCEALKPAAAPAPQVWQGILVTPHSVSLRAQNGLIIDKVFVSGIYVGKAINSNEVQMHFFESYQPKPSRFFVKPGS
jgi:hypothetical protein